VFSPLLSYGEDLIYVPLLGSGAGGGGGPLPPPKGMKIQRFLLKAGIDLSEAGT